MDKIKLLKSLICLLLDLNTTQIIIAKIMIYSIPIIYNSIKKQIIITEKEEEDLIIIDIEENA